MHLQTFRLTIRPCLNYADWALISCLAVLYKGAKKSTTGWVNRAWASVAAGTRFTQARTMA